jgi:hypothetical protein
MMATVLDEPVIRLRVALTEPFAVVVADEAALKNDRIEPAVREGVGPALFQPVIEALPLFELLPASVYAAVAVTVERPQPLTESG